MKILLTQGKFAIVGPKDYGYLMQWKWCYNNGYAVRTDCTNGRRRVYMHRVILERMGYTNFVRSDHRNRNRLDNRRGNLRTASAKQSQHNRNKFRSNVSGYIGVTWQQGKWCVRIRENGKLEFHGYYVDPKEAARVYNEAALKYRGEFAVLNEV